MSASEPIRAAPIELWRIAQTFINTLFNLFGAPEEIAAQHTHLAKQRALILRWLRTGEALLRQLLLIEAAALPRPAPCAPRAKRLRVRKLMGFDAAHPEQWRVSFRCLLPQRALRQAQGDAKRSVGLCLSKTGAPRRFFSAWPIAERCEAMLRAYNDPAPYARRLARRLYAAPRRARALCSAPPDAERYVEAIGQTCQAALCAHSRFESG